MSTPDTPMISISGVERPMTDAEVAQLTADRAAWKAAADAAAAADANYVTMRDRIDQAITNWPTLTPAQKDAVLKALARLVLHRLDTAT